MVSMTRSWVKYGENLLRIEGSGGEEWLGFLGSTRCRRVVMAETSRGRFGGTSVAAVVTRAAMDVTVILRRSFGFFW